MIFDNEATLSGKVSAMDGLTLKTLTDLGDPNLVVLNVGLRVWVVFDEV